MPLKENATITRDVRLLPFLSAGVCAMGILSWIVFGLIAGFLAKWIMPGADPGGIIVTILLGIAGAFVGGFIATQLGWGTVTEFNIRSFAVAIAGAVLLLWLYRVFKRR
jgi:uncharacterized membrane protein YeaQ/YmgE (transglycosylase-associated protein family)